MPLIESAAAPVRELNLHILGSPVADPVAQVVQQIEQAFFELLAVDACKSSRPRVRHQIAGDVGGQANRLDLNQFNEAFGDHHVTSSFLYIFAGQGMRQAASPLRITLIVISSWPGGAGNLRRSGLRPGRFSSESTRASPRPPRWQTFVFPGLMAALGKNSGYSVGPSAVFGP
jgi:hypothetical protein